MYVCTHLVYMYVYISLATTFTKKVSIQLTFADFLKFELGNDAWGVDVIVRNPVEDLVEGSASDGGQHGGECHGHDRRKRVDVWEGGEKGEHFEVGAAMCCSML